MTKSSRLLVVSWIMVLCLCLTACDMTSFLDSFGLSFGSKAEVEAPETIFTLPPVSEQPVETEATEAPTVPPTEAEPDPDLYWVAAVGGLNVRKGTSTDYPAVGLLEEGLVVQVLDWHNGWAYIEYPYTGWCSGDYLQHLGWYNDIQMPLSNPLQNTELVGQWIHVTQPTGSGNHRRTRVGLYELRSDGTFTHSIAEFIIDDDGQWAIDLSAADRPQWVGEYDFDGETLTLNYMAYVNLTFSQSGIITAKKYFSAPYIMETTISMTADLVRFTVPNAELIPCYVGYGTSNLTSNTFYRVSSNREFPKNIRDTLNKWFP